MSPPRSVDATEPPAPPPPPHGRTAWTTHLARFAIAVLVVLAVTSIVARIRQDPLPADPGAPRALAPAAAPTLPARIAKLEARSAAAPDDAANWQQLGTAYVQRSIQTLDTSYYDLAARAFDRADALAPDDLGTILGRASLASTQHRFVDSLALANQVLAVDPYSAGALALRVDAEIELGRYDAAETHLQQFLDRKPGAAALARVAYLRELEGDLAGSVRAITDAETAASGDTAFERATYASVAGDTLLAAGRFADARRAYARALDFEPELPGAIVGAARIDAVSGHAPRAVAALDRLVERVPLPAAASLLAEVQERDGNPAAASRALATVRAIDQLQAAAGSDVELDIAVFDADNAPVDPAGIQRALATYQHRPSVYAADALAWTLFRSGDAGAAAAVLPDATRLGTADAQILFHQAMILDALGDTDGAATALDAAARGNPFFSIARQPEARALAARLGTTWPTEAGS